VPVFLVAFGQFTVTGVDATLVKVVGLAATAGAFAITGNDATLAATHQVTGGTGAFSVTGIAAALQRNTIALAGDTGSFAVTGVDAQWLTGRLVVGAVGSFAVTGIDATLTKSASPAVWTTGVSSITYSNSDRTATGSATSEKSIITTTAKSTGKWYIELSYVTNASNRETDEFWGVATSSSAYPGNTGSGGFGIADTRSVTSDIAGTRLGVLPAWSSGTNVYMFAIDFGAKKAWFGVNGTWRSGADPAAGTTPCIVSWTGTPSLYAAARVYYNTDAVTIVTSPAYLPSGFTQWDS
jgi:hypothetical protein